MTPKIRSALLAALALALVLVAPAGSALTAPTATGPVDGAVVETLPAFSWNAVTGADRYEFEFSADPAFNSALALVSTKNTRASLKKVVPNGTYYWRVRGVTSTGALGTWSPTRSLEMAWTAKPSLLAPGNGATIEYPADALKLSWSPVDDAAEYVVRIATDPALGSLIWDDPVETVATSFALTQPLAPGTYYWGITPVNAEGHAGNPSVVSSFEWVWPSTTTTGLSDLVADEEVFDPQLSWDAVPGASGYEVEVNFSSDWATSSKVCCEPFGFYSEASTLGTTLAPQVVLDNNTYYWRVRALDAGGNAGVWNVGPSFQKTFDNVPPVTAPAIKNLRMRDHAGDPGSDAVPATPEYDTPTPVVVWDPVPGASGYQAEVAPFSGGVCNWSSSSEHWTKVTATTAWTPLGWGWNNTKPFPSSLSVSTDSPTALVAGNQYCARVRAIDRASALGGPTVFGDYTYLPANNEPAFTWTGPTGSGACSPCTLTESDYVTPITGTTVGRMPVFTWQPIAGAESYYVIVARDANFTNLVDYAFTRIPAYAPRTGILSRGYADETTLYYWAVLPADATNGSGVSAEPLTSAPQSFTKQSTPPSLVGPVSLQVVNTPSTTFRWNAVEGARRYRVQVAQDATFSSPIDDVVTDATAYTSNTTYPSDTTLYWRVRADAENGSAYVGLTWSATGTFKKQLPKPVFDPDNPTGGAGVPAFSWSPVAGAISYDIQIEEADGDTRLYKGFPTHAAAFVRFTGVGILKVWVRANFPGDGFNPVAGPWSNFWSYTHTIPEPSDPAHEAGTRRLLFSWAPRANIKSYRVQVSERADFGSMVENTTTQTTTYASLLTSFAYADGGTFYWRVAAVDADANQGDFTAVRSFTLPALTAGGGATTTLKTFRVAIDGVPVKNRYRTITVRVRNSAYQPVRGASVRVSGAGVGITTKLTNRYGRASFRLRATRYPGTVTFRISKSGFRTAYAYRNVRRP
ncbi:MAG TPA: carboxypeptidase-like regulatory domain-containing protein [Gaiellaceae bacterium]|nr:carboxypeptidase-like regulatory domain-containing protein [Gaiellaceae bacterium]